MVGLGAVVRIGHIDFRTQVDFRTDHKDCYIGHTEELAVPSVVVAVVVGPVAAAATQDVALVEALLAGAGLEEALREAGSPVAVVAQLDEVVLPAEVVRPVEVVLPVEVVCSVEVVLPVEMAGAAKVAVAVADSVLGMVVVAAVEVVQFVAVVQGGVAAADLVLLRVALAGQFPADTTEAETVVVAEVPLALAAVVLVGIGGQVLAP